MSGHGSFVSLGRSRTNKWRIGDSVRWVSPGLELNDLGFLRQADAIQNEFTAGYADPVPRGVIRQWSVFARRQDGWDFGGRQTNGVTGLSADTLFRNKWRLGGALQVIDTEVDTRLPRGGPSMRLSPFLHMSLTGLTLREPVRLVRKLHCLQEGHGHRGRAVRRPLPRLRARRDRVRA